MNFVRLVFRYSDRRLLAVAAIVLLGTLMLNFAVAGSARQEVSTARAEQVRVQEGLTALQQQIALLSTDGASADINQLVAKIGVGEQAVPQTVDQIRTTARVAQLASSAGLILSQFDPSPGSPLTDVELGILKATPYEFKVSGSLVAVDSFMEAVMLEPSWFVTFEAISLFPEALPGASSNEAASSSVFASSVGASGTMLFWGLAVPPVLRAAVVAPSDQPGVPSGQPVVPPGPSGVPAPSTAPLPSGALPPSGQPVVPPAPSGAPAPSTAPLPSGAPPPSVPAPTPVP